MWHGFRTEWQRRMIALARSVRAKEFMQSNRAASFLVRKYVAGETSRDGARRAVELLRAQGLRASLYYLGEYVDTPELIHENVDQKLRAVEALGGAGIDIHVSVDPTQIGFQQDHALARRNAEAIARAIAAASAGKAGLHCMMLDMEDLSVAESTIALHDELRAQQLPVALTLQAYLRRTAADLGRQIQLGSKVRMVKGAFAESAEVAYQGDAAVKANFRALIERMFSSEARERSFYPILATHDTALHDLAIGLARKNAWAPGTYEFEMLLGVRPDVSSSLAQRGERVRLYLPFGRDWWPYAVRRIGENPANIALLGRSLFT